MSDTRAALLAAAARVVTREGGRALTLDAVAREAGVSKGGLLYHFASKEALIRGLVDELVARFDEDLEALSAADPAPGRLTRAYLRATLRDLGNVEFLAAIAASLANDPALLDALRRRAVAWQAAIEADGIDPAVATTVRLAVDGWWFATLIGLSPPVEPLRTAVLATLEALTHPRCS